jgi:hypothetical protein
MVSFLNELNMAHAESTSRPVLMAAVLPGLRKNVSNFFEFGKHVVLSSDGCVPNGQE